MTNIRSLTQNDPEELHAFAALFSAYMKSARVRDLPENVRAIVAELKRELSAAPRKI